MIKSSDLDKEEKDINYQESVASDSVLTEQFLSTFNGLIMTIANKPSIIVKSKNLLRSTVCVLSQICEIDNVAIFYKKKRLLKVFTKILKDLKKIPEAFESLIIHAKLFLHIFAKVGKRRSNVIR